MLDTNLPKSDLLDKAQEFELNLLQAISSILTSSLNLKDTLVKIYGLLDDLMGIGHGVLTLVDPYTNKLHMEMAYGLIEDEIKHKNKLIQGGIEERVIKRNEPFHILELDKASSDIKNTIPKSYTSPVSYICLPLSLSKKKIGTLSAVFPYRDTVQFNKNYKLLSFIGLMIAQEVQLMWLMESEKDALKRENTLLKDELKEKYNIHNMVGNSSTMHLVYENIIQVASSNATVLIRGESGTGKELVAHAIHYNSPRVNGPFIKLNCGAIPESLIETELFGHEKGAFTDAQDTKIGRFEAAEGGTLFLDEIGELTPSVQIKLLRVLQEKEITRIGSNTPLKVSVRVVTATNRDLELEVKEKRFREDLYYRLNVFPIFLPPLRERKSDILLLSEHFLNIFSKENNKKINRISSISADLLTTYHWPGNVRELENCIERAVLVCQSDVIQASHLPRTLQTINTTESTSDNLSFSEMVQNFESELLIDALKRYNGNKSKVAKALKTTTRIIGYKLDQFQIDPNNFKST